MILLFVMSAILCAENSHLYGDDLILPNVDSVIKDYVARPIVFDETPFPDKGDILVIECDATQDGRKDILLSGSKLLTDLPLRWTSWRIYKGEATGEYRRLIYGMAFDPSEVFLYEDDKGVFHLATLTPPDRDGVSLIKALELVKDSYVSPEAYGTVGVDSEEGQAWIEERMEEATNLVRRIPADEIARRYTSETSDGGTLMTKESKESPNANANEMPAVESHEPPPPADEETAPTYRDEPHSATSSVQQSKGELEAPDGTAPVEVVVPYNRLLLAGMGLLTIVFAVLGAVWYRKR